MTDDQDPMLHGNEQEQSAYKSAVMNIVRQAIAEDRQSHLGGAEDVPATLVGGAGFTGSRPQISQAVP